MAPPTHAREDSAADYIRRLEELATLWSDLEELLKRAEYMQVRVVVPAINELRYSGRSMIAALRAAVSEPSEASRDQTRFLDEAISHAREAQFDLADAIVFATSRTIEELTHAHSERQIVHEYPHFLSVKEALTASMDLIQRSRDTSLRSSNYEELIRRHLPVLMRHLESGRSEKVYRSVHRAIELRWRRKRDAWLLLIAAMTMTIVSLQVVQDMYVYRSLPRWIETLMNWLMGRR